MVRAADRAEISRLFQFDANGLDSQRTVLNGQHRSSELRVGGSSPPVRHTKANEELNRLHARSLIAQKADGNTAPLPRAQPIAP